MPEFINLQTTLEDGIFTITINRESKLNALNLATLQELDEAVNQVYHNNEIKGCILTGAGTKAFVAGADISEIARQDRASAQKMAEEGQRIFQSLENCPKPIIAAINGFALGGGCELAMACHLRVATTSAKFGQPEVNLGLIPGYGGTQRLTRLIGRSRALEYMMTGDIITADQAHGFGLVNHLSDSPDAMMNRCRELLHKIFSKAPIAIGHVIESVNAVSDSSQDGYQLEAENFGHCCATDDFKEGTSAFLEKRSPKFQGK